MTLVCVKPALVGANGAGKTTVTRSEASLVGHMEHADGEQMRARSRRLFALLRRYHQDGTRGGSEKFIRHAADQRAGETGAAV